MIVCSLILTHNLHWLITWYRRRAPSIPSSSWWDCSTLLPMCLHPLRSFRNMSYSMTPPLRQRDCSPITAHRLLVHRHRQSELEWQSVVLIFRFLVESSPFQFFHLQLPPGASEVQIRLSEMLHSIAIPVAAMRAVKLSHSCKPSRGMVAFFLVPEVTGFWPLLRLSHHFSWTFDIMRLQGFKQDPVDLMLCNLPTCSCSSFS